jgi:hypothetical protein
VVLHWLSGCGSYVVFCSNLQPGYMDRWDKDSADDLKIYQRQGWPWIPDSWAPDTVFMPAITGMASPSQQHHYLEPFLYLYSSIKRKALAIFSRKWLWQIIQEICALDGEPALIFAHIMCSFFSLYCQFIYAIRLRQQQQCSPVQLSSNLHFL